MSRRAFILTLHDGLIWSAIRTGHQSRNAEKRSLLEGVVERLMLFVCWLLNVPATC